MASVTKTTIERILSNNRSSIFMFKIYISKGILTNILNSTNLVNKL